MEWFFQYVIFLAETVTVVLAILFVVIFIMAQRKKSAPQGNLEIKDLTLEYQDIKETMQMGVMTEAELKQFNKTQKKLKKHEKKLAKQNQKKAAEKQHDANSDGQAATGSKPTCYVLAFNGSVDAHEVEDLRQEVSAVLAVINPLDKVILKLESPGGVVHGYGLAASQLMRFRKRDIHLTAIVDKVAASGGYMMACTANEIIAAPFAIVGSIGVVAQIPNFHRLLKKNEIDVELQTAGQYKRTLTMFGENTAEGRQKFQQELEETHLLFKEFVAENRPNLNIDEVATGEHWFAIQAKEKGLVDEIGTSDDVILSQIEQYKIIEVKFHRRKKLSDRLAKNVVSGVEKLLFRNSRTGS
ncbi:inner membrane peptidase [Orbus hercynius]|uniref:Inner membrane peptidase n=1 Tax=Orbus hercynius TaxID=593135 RepID=A0A495RFV3_9GAMM|nr:protease SohB [Orbus hercynius]RKS85768.1 inner membrane peptidase [Orbus hercynius]